MWKSKLNHRKEKIVYASVQLLNHFALKKLPNPWQWKRDGGNDNLLVAAFIVSGTNTPTPRPDHAVTKNLETYAQWEMQTWKTSYVWTLIWNVQNMEIRRDESRQEMCGRITVGWIWISAWPTVLELISPSQYFLLWSQGPPLPPGTLVTVPSNLGTHCSAVGGLFANLTTLRGSTLQP